MYPHSWLWYYLWLAPHTLLAVLAVVMVRRRLAREFPAFFAYVVCQVLQTATLFSLDYAAWSGFASVSPYRYWEVYWAFLFLSIGLRFAVIYEIFACVLRGYPGLWELSRRLFRWGAALLVLTAIAISAYAPISDPHRFLTGVHAVNRAVSLVQIGQLLFLFLFSSYFRVSWRNYGYGIALGLGIFSSVDLATSAIRASLGPVPGNYVFDFITMGTYHCCVLLWLAYLLAPEPSRGPAKQFPADDLEQWNLELERLLLR